MFKPYFCLMAFFLILSLSPVFGQGADTTAKSNDVDAKKAAAEEADYQNFIKGHVGYKLLSVEHDKFKSITNINTDPRMMNELDFKSPSGGGTHLSFEAFGVVPDKVTKTKQPSAILLISSSTDNWEYLKCNEFNWLVDGEPFKWQEETYSNDVITGGVIETFAISLSPKQFDKLAKAKKIECKICNDEFVFVRNQFWVMRWVNEKLKEVIENTKKPVSQ